nr:hypothetical protein [Tanacetum cinerariifolium]
SRSKSTSRLLSLFGALAFSLWFPMQSSLPYLVGSWLGFVSLLNSRPYFAMVGNTVDITTFVLTQIELYSHCSLFNILTELRSEFPDRNAIIKDSPTGKIGIYLDVGQGFVLLSHGLMCVVLFVAEMGLLDFVKSVDPFKVKIDERTLADNEVPLLEENGDRVISPSAQPFSLVDHTIEDELKDNTGKKKRNSSTALWRLELQSGAKGAESGYASHPSEEFVSSSITPTPEPDVLEDSGSTPEVNVQTRRVTKRFVVTTSTGASSVPRDNAGTSTSVSDNHALCRTVLDHITPHGYWVALHNQTDARFLDSFNINSAQHACIASELHLRYEHEIMSKERFQKKFTESSAVVQQRDEEIASLKAKLETTEKESAELSRFCGRVSELEIENVAAQRFKEQSAKLDARIADVRRDMDTDLYPHMLTAIVGRRWVLGHGVRLVMIKCAQSSECHSALGKELEALKDSPLDLIMSALTLDGDADSTPRLRELQASLDQVTVHVYSEPSGSRGVSSISHEMLLSDVILAIRMRAEKRRLASSSSSAEGGVIGVVLVHDSSLGVIDYQVSTLVHTRDAASTALPHDDLFDTTVLDESS